jgi:two-component system nitrogen regulation response regulator GlnG
VRPRKVEVKLVVATNEDLGELVRAGRFRADLYMRLNPAATVRLPPLRERRMDIERLLAFSVERSAEQAAVQELLREYVEAFGLPMPEGERLPLRLATGPLPDASGAGLTLLVPDRTLRLLRQHAWPGNLREFAMTVENAITLTLAEAMTAGRAARTGPAADRPDVVQVRPKLVRDLLLAVSGAEEVDEGGWGLEVRVRPHEGLNKVAQDVERQYFTRLYLQERGDFAAMAAVLLGDPEAGRKVQLRFNQLGLKVRELKARIP